MSKDLLSDLARLPDLPEHITKHIWRNSDHYTRNTLVSNPSLPPTIFKEVLKSDDLISHWALFKPRPLTQIHRAVKATNSLNALLHLSTQPNLAPRTLELIREKALTLEQPMLILNMILAFKDDQPSLEQLIPAYIKASQNPSTHMSFREYRDITKKYFLASPLTAIVALDALSWDNSEALQITILSLINQNFRSNDTDPANITPPQHPNQRIKGVKNKKPNTYIKNSKVFKEFKPKELEELPLPTLEHIKIKIISKLQQLPIYLTSSEDTLEDIYKDLEKILNSLASLTNLTIEDINQISSIPLPINYSQFTNRHQLESKYSISALTCSFDDFTSNHQEHADILTAISTAKLTHSVTDKFTLIIEALIHAEHLPTAVYKDISTYLFGPQASLIANFLSKPKYYKFLLTFATNHGVYFIPKSPLRKKVIIDLSRSNPKALSPKDLTNHELKLVITHASPLSALISEELYLEKIVSRLSDLPETQQIAALILLEGWHSDITSLISSSSILVR